MNVCESQQNVVDSCVTNIIGLLDGFPEADGGCAQDSADMMNFMRQIMGRTSTSMDGIGSYPPDITGLLTVLANLVCSKTSLREFVADEDVVSTLLADGRQIAIDRTSIANGTYSAIFTATLDGLRAIARVSLSSGDGGDETLEFFWETMMHTMLYCQYRRSNSMQLFARPIATFPLNASLNQVGVGSSEKVRIGAPTGDAKCGTLSFCGLIQAMDFDLDDYLNDSRTGEVEVATALYCIAYKLYAIGMHWDFMHRDFHPGNVMGLLLKSPVTVDGIGGSPVATHVDWRIIDLGMATARSKSDPTVAMLQVGVYKKNIGADARAGMNETHDLRMLLGSLFADPEGAAVTAVGSKSGATAHLLNTYGPVTQQQPYHFRLYGNAVNDADPFFSPQNVMRIMYDVINPH